MKTLTLITLGLAACVALVRWYALIQVRNTWLAQGFYMTLVVGSITAILWLTQDWLFEFVWACMMLIMSSAGSVIGFIRR